MGPVSYLMPAFAEKVYFSSSVSFHMARSTGGVHSLSAISFLFFRRPVCRQILVRDKQRRCARNTHAFSCPKGLRVFATSGHPPWRKEEENRRRAFVECTSQWRTGVLMLPYLYRSSFDTG